MPQLINKKYYCKYCPNLVREVTYKYGKGQCNTCANSGKNNPNYKDGRTKANKYYCKDCSKSISISSARYGKGRCSSCAQKGNLFGISKRHNYRGYSMRSSQEVVYAKYLDKNKVAWEYESKTFDLGNTTYTPDFYLKESGFFIEIKGWFRKEAKKKFKLFKIMYPKVRGC